MPMFIDFNISSNFPDEHVEKILKSQIKTIIISQTVKPNNIPTVKLPEKISISIKQYNCITVDLSLNETTKTKTNTTSNLSIPINKSIIQKLSHFDIICLKVYDYNQLKTAIEMQPDVISFDFGSETLRLRPGLLREVINKDIYFQITLRDGLYEKKGNWLRNMHDLLSVVRGTNCVVGSGACLGSEVKSKVDVTDMFQYFGVKNKRIDTILSGGNLLKMCALKRFSFRNTLANDVEKNELKKDYIIINMS